MSVTLIKLNSSKVSAAVGALKQVVEKSKKNDDLITDVDVVQLQICVKKIPPKEKTVKLKLPHSLRQPDMEICLFVKDLDKDDREYEATVRHFQDILKKKRIDCVTDIIPLKSLKTEYKPFEAKRNLSNAYDIFLADARIVRLLPTYLGKHFYGKKKTPVQVNLQANDLAKEFATAIDNSRCVISAKGSSSLTVVGNMQMSQADITLNVIEAAQQLSGGVPGGASNIKQMSLKTKQSVSIPIYMSEGGPQDVTVPREATDKQNIEAEEITTLFGAKVKVFPSGYIKIIKDGEAEEEPQKRKRSKRKKQNQMKKTQQLRGIKKSSKTATTKQVKRLKTK